MLLRLVGREAGPDGGDLEQHAARLPEVDRAEVEAVDHRSGIAAAGDDLLAPGLVVFQRRGPRDVMDGARAAKSTRLGSRVVDVEGAARVASRLVAVRPGALETQGLAEELMARVTAALKRPHARKALKSEVRGDFRMARDEWLVARRLSDELEAQALRVVEAKPVVFADAIDAGRGQAPRPEPERLIARHSEGGAVDHPCARAAPNQARILEEREVSARAAFLIRIEEVIDGGVVLVDGLLDQPEAHDAGVEQDIPGGVCRDRADVMDSVQRLHLVQLLPGRASHF